MSSKFEFSNSTLEFVDLKWLHIAPVTFVKWRSYHVQRTISPIATDFLSALKVRQPIELGLRTLEYGR